jgi:(E)-4-hydroxy-3-methylbut-2-enyl-diphosphate synthase
MTAGISRRASRPVRVGQVVIGGDAPVSLQSMTNTVTTDVDATVAQVERLAEAGCQIVRVAVPDEPSAAALGRIRERISLPLVADVHFRAELALAAIEAGVDKVRLNPGNLRRRRDVERVIEAAKAARIAIRFGVNSGSIRARAGDARQAERGADPVELMVERTLEYVCWAEALGFRDIVLSLKASDAPATMRAYRRIAGCCDYPLHLGVTAAGPLDLAVVKSAVALGGLLSEGIGDTIRVSLTGDPVAEVHVGRQILEAVGLRAPTGLQIVSCPTCGRCRVDLASLGTEARRRLGALNVPVKVAIMGCVVNGPGEAEDADVGVAMSEEAAMLFAGGRMLRRVPAEGALDALIEEVRRRGGRHQAD